MVEPPLQCRVCSKILPIEAFYARQISMTKNHGECKDCTKARVKARARTNPKVQKYERERSSTPARRQHLNQNAQRWNARNPQAYKAHYAVTNAVRDGRLKREPCLFCGGEKVHGHHRDYTKPLEVIWLCPKCHHRLHANFPETEAVGKGGN